MALDRFVTLGRSGLRVSPLCLGTLTFGPESGYGAPVADSVRMLHLYMERGGNFIDTANYYSYGHAEVIIGDTLAASPGQRHRMVVATKFGTNTSANDPNAGGASRKSIIAALEQSLRRLRTDYVDLYWQHYADPFVPVEETMRALDDLVRSGKVRYLGMSDNPAWRTVEAHLTAALQGGVGFSAIQLEYSLAERGMELEHRPMAQELGLGITPFALLADGVLTGKHRQATPADSTALRADLAKHRMKDRLQPVVEALTAVAGNLGISCARAAVAWVLHQPGISSGIVGARTVQQLEDNLAAASVKLDRPMLDALNDASRPRRTYSSAMVENLLPLAYPGFTIDGRTIPRNHFSPDPSKTYL